MSATLAEMLEDRRLLITAGAGGVGKTTTAAALALMAAMDGQRAAVLTIDPARRLANALGLEAFTGETRRVDEDHFRAAGLEVRGELHAMMLDIKATSDQMVHRFAPDEAAVERILNNRYYQAFSAYLSGTQEYMAIEKVTALIDEGGFDLVVLDTPPAVHALEFLDAPERLLNALDNRAVNWLYKPESETGAARRFGTRLLGRGRKVITRSLDRLTGGPFFEDLSTFLAAFSALFGAFRERSLRVRALLREPTTAFLVVAAPSPASVMESIRFAEQIQARGLPFGAFVCNRVHRHLPPVEADAATVAERLRAVAGNGAADGLARRMLAGLADHNRMADRDAAAVERLADAAGRPPAVVPLFAEDVHDLRGLRAIGRHLVGR